MGWIQKAADAAKRVWTHHTPDRTYARLEKESTPWLPGPRALVPDKDYVSIYLRSSFVPYDRLGLSVFRGTVMSQSSLTHAAKGEAAFHVVSAPEMLRATDPEHAERVLSVSLPLLDTVPYRGGSIAIELGLFAEKTADRAAPLLSVVSRMAESAGISLVSAATPFVGPLRHAMDVLAGHPGLMTILIGIDTVFDAPSTGYWVLSEAPSAQNLSRMSLDPTRFCLMDKGQPWMDAPYIIFSVEATEHNPNWYKIEELNRAHRELHEALKPRQGVNVNKQAMEKLSYFRVVVQTCPDLQFDDASEIAKTAAARVDKVLAGGVNARGGSDDVFPMELRDLMPPGWPGVTGA